MKRKFDLLYNIPVWNKVFFAFYISIACLLIFFFIALLIAVVFYDLSFQQAKQYIVSGPDFDNTAIIRLFQIFQTVGAFIIPAFILAYIFHSNYKEYLKLNKNPFYASVILAVLSVFISIPLINFLADLNSRVNLPDFLSGLESKIIDLENDASNLMDDFLSTPTIKGYIINIIMIAILPAIGEELLFRGIFQRLFIEWTKNTHLGILIAAFLFSFIHMQFFGFLPRLLLGIYFGYLFAWSRTVWLPIIAHFTNNAIAVSYFHFLVYNQQMSGIEHPGSGKGNLIFLLLSLSIFTGLVFLVYYMEKIKNTGKNIKRN